MTDPAINAARVAREEEVAAERGEHLKALVQHYQRNPRPDLLPTIYEAMRNFGGLHIKIARGRGDGTILHPDEQQRQQRLDQEWSEIIKTANDLLRSQGFET